MLFHQLTDAAIPEQGENMENEIERWKRIFRERDFTRFDWEYLD